MTAFNVLPIFLTAALFLQGASSTPVVTIGSIAGRLTADDRAQIAALAQAAGGTPWVLDGHQPFGPDPTWAVDVFLVSDRTAVGLRRGRMLSVSARLPAWTAEAEKVPRTWALTRSWEYAQVPVPGSDPNAVTTDRDLNRPFRVSVPLSDADLVSLVAFIRASPALPSAQSAAPVFSKVQGTWPIRAVVPRIGTGAALAVGLIGPNDESSGQDVELGRSPDGWAVVRLLSYVV